MKKQIKYAVFLLLMLFISINGINALTCSYNTKDNELNATFKITEKNNKAGRVTINGTFSTDDKSHKDKIEETDEIRNWDSDYSPWFSDDFTFSTHGKEYYIEHAKCPPYAFLVDRLSGLDFLVATTAAEINDLEEYGKTKQGYAILNLYITESDDNKYEGKSCSEYKNESNCLNNEYFSCVWNVNEFNKKGYCNTDKLVYVKCGGSFDIPYEAPKIISFLIAFLKIVIPIVLIFIAILSLLKAVAATNEDEIKKAQKSLVRKIAAAVLAFFVISIVQFVIMKVADSGEIDDISSCLSCFLNNDCDGAAYYKTNVAGKYLCTKLDGSNEEFECPEYESLTK